MNFNNVGFNQMNFIKSMYGSSGLGGISNKYNYADRNTAKLQSIITKRYRQELNVTNELASYRDSTKSFYNDFYPAMDELKTAAAKLKNTSSSSTMDPTGYGSTNSKAVSDVVGSLDSMEEIAVDVKQIATGQVSSFDSISSASKGAIDGKGSIELSIGGKTKKLELDISANATNEDALKQVASKINEAKAGVKAEVITKDGKSSLQIADQKTGEKSSFSVKLSGSLSTLGTESVTKGQNAIYTAGGKEHTSESNRVKLADGKLSATLTGKGAATLAKKVVDPDVVKNSVKDFAKAYNSVLDTLQKHSGKSPAIANLKRSFENSKFVAPSLSSVGVEVDYSGKLTVNDSKFEASFKNDPAKVKRILGSGNGFAAETMQKASSAIVNSSRLIQPPKSIGFGRFYGSSIGSLLDTWA